MRERLIKKLDEADLFLRNRANAKPDPLNKYDISILKDIAKTCDEAARIIEKAIVPPCKVGQKVYSQRGCFFLPYEKDINKKDVIPCEVIAIKATKKGKYILLKPLLIETRGMRSSNKWFLFSAIGKTVFLTREEAEQALKGGAEK